ncbi:hypothetical protein ACSSAF_00865 [Staphylococcus succinus]|uniref:hypothetical protein n=1 Tax=Staphylococcus succinus TaxID=61015 RepID=UPI003F5C3C55
MEIRFFEERISNNFLLSQKNKHNHPIITAKDEIIQAPSPLPLFHSFALTKKKRWDNKIVDLFLNEAVSYFHGK